MPAEDRLPEAPEPLVKFKVPGLDNARWAATCEQ
jgi:hypothetical protein